MVTHPGLEIDGAKLGKHYFIILGAKIQQTIKYNDRPNRK